MKRSTLVALLTALAALLAVAAANAAAGPAKTRVGLVFVQTNEPTGNRVVVYAPGSDGRLTEDGAYATGGNGSAALPGSETDHLASQGSLVYDAAHKLLIAVNAGSDSVTTFRVQGDRLGLADVAACGGGFPPASRCTGTSSTC